MAVTHADSSAGNDVARAVFAGLPRRYDRLGYLLSFGQDRRWRNAVVDIIASAHPGRVLDVATGPAGVAIAVARRTPASVVGIDLNEPMLREGARNTRRAERTTRGRCATTGIAISSDSCRAGFVMRGRSASIT